MRCQRCLIGGHQVLADELVEVERGERPRYANRVSGLGPADLVPCIRHVLVPVTARWIGEHSYDVRLRG